jgi:hypothetical protein
MIKLVDLLSEDVDGKEDEKDYVNMHWRDHLRKIIKHASKALKSNDPDLVTKQTLEIMKHADAAHEKNYNKHITQGVDGVSALSNVHTGNVEDF